MDLLQVVVSQKAFDTLRSICLIRDEQRSQRDINEDT